MSFANLKPVKVWGKGGPNPPKVVTVLEELGVPYEEIAVALSDVKKPEYTAINPNGRVPSIHDPNTGLTVWESGAIIEYLTDKYDPEHKISFPPGTPEYYHARQFLFFQVSGQGPYYGQAAWFKAFHPEKLPSAVERYVGEINRVTAVLERVLSENEAKAAATGGGDGPWLVGGKYSYADLAFAVWQSMVTKFVSPEEYDPESYPTVNAWIKRIQERPAVQVALGEARKLE